mmetsp:Transcript_26266/g.41667  ORF Transcript_26266/g.41667 Transcript_26266/m.41667 type:complete len:169 (-) Transcript_26266:34-540(-)|eukprot:CAMPEP_0197027864 /NCGR_PEP_ID=MMETSP1384-20130603/7727_1 /TAXON_ID=29189 /ORGANISM="Ammonia sp." /LENGTH=168 /DNA_ID=CAMNT_0042456779 /DNA_START=92 /DNA_END=598 /DNA_ORIENTATION=+
MCNQAGCFANRFCAIILGLLNTAMMVGYFMGVVIMEMQCKESCYSAVVFLVGVLGGPILLYIVGYFISWLAFQKGAGKSEGCNFCCVVFWSLILLTLLGVMCYHAYYMVADATYQDSDIYGGMVCGNVAYAAFLCLVLCNVMPIKEKPGRADFNHLEESHSDASATAV